MAFKFILRKETFANLADFIEEEKERQKLLAAKLFFYSAFFSILHFK